MPRSLSSALEAVFFEQSEIMCGKCQVESTLWPKMITENRVVDLSFFELIKSVMIVI